MLNWKKKAAAVTIAAVMMVPGTAYGHSAVINGEGHHTYQVQWLQYLMNCIDIPEMDIPGSGDNIGNSENVSAVAEQMLAQVNRERRSAGLSELTLSRELSNVAEIKAEDMRDHGYFSHTSPTYGSPFEMMKQFGISYRKAGENIAKGQKTVSEVMNGWMKSSGHRENILNKDFTHMGVGYCTDRFGNGYWVQMFISR
ncbi:MAG: hypothetical protein IJ486_10345 [Firmicutes bacterium]|nr:hypothetical protein [Bacillota bacterium]